MFPQKGFIPTRYKCASVNDARKLDAARRSKQYRWSKRTDSVACDLRGAGGFAVPKPRTDAGRRVDRGRDFGAWLGLVPRQYSTGGRSVLGRISKRGSKYLRTLLIHGARAALPSLSASPSPMGEWLRGLIGRSHKNKVIVALAGKLARIAWAILRSGDNYVKVGRPAMA